MGEMELYSSISDYNIFLVRKLNNRSLQKVVAVRDSNLSFDAAAKRMLAVSRMLGKRYPSYEFDIQQISVDSPSSLPTDFSYANEGIQILNILVNLSETYENVMS